MKKFLLSLVLVSVLCSASFADLRWGVFSDINGESAGVLLNVNKVWDFQLMYNSYGADYIAEDSDPATAFGLLGTYYFYKL